MNTPFDKLRASLRPSPIAGAWYEANPKRLAASIDSYLAEAQLPELKGEVIAVIAPHAGHKYSGHVAGYAFAALRGRAPELVVVLSPFHNFAPYPLITTAHAAYSTPLGNIAVDTSALAELQNALSMPIMAVPNDKEHSLEIELPFLQRALQGDFKLLPLMLRAQEPAVAKELGDALVKILKGKNAILVASTDLSHFYDSHTAKILDDEMLARFASFEPDSIFAAEHTGKGFACGHAAVAAMLHAARGLGADKVQILKYATSGDITGDQSSVVGYGAAAVLKEF
jgi:AmmeMemoRadiSam system protein B